MINQLKRFISPSTKQSFKRIKATIENYTVARLMHLRHRRLLKKIQKKQKIKVIFFVMKSSMWKADEVFKKMLDDPYFDPLILVCPYISEGDAKMFSDLEETLRYFSNKGYPVKSAYEKNTEKWVTLEELKPDLIFFTNPHKATKKEYYKKAFLNYLSCYLPYHHEIGIDIEQYNQLFHNAMWKIFTTHQTAKSWYLKLSHHSDRSIHLTGYPMLEAIESISYMPKLQNEQRIKIVYAPHHEIWAKKPYSTFTKYAQFMQQLAEKYKDSIFLIFKPHPILKGKLYQHPQWGREKTDTYYQYWANQENTMISEGNYLELFQSSDALIHDCGSFILEYLYFKKPIMFLYSEGNSKSHYNEMGLQALGVAKSGYNEQDIEQFIQTLLDNKHGKMQVNINNFYKEEILPYLQPLPSEKITSILKRGLQQSS